MRRIQGEVPVYAGTVTVAGFAYALRAVVEVDAEGRYFRLSVHLPDPAAGEVGR